ncbi:MAG: FKBP-type peptidyl-prolyl cis-trans isomerase [Longimicrobiales bacterium]
MRLKFALHAGLALGLGMVGVTCGDSSTAPEPFSVDDVVFDDELTVDQADLQETDSGLYFHDEAVGDGPQPTAESIVSLHYTLWLPDGTLLADTRQEGERVSWDLATTGLIPGFEEGILGMSEGGVRILVVPPELAYGEAGTDDGAIPPNSGLVFRIELVAVDAAFDVNDVVFADELSVTVDDLQETPSGLYFHDTVVGDGTQAADGSTVEVHYTVWLPDATLVEDTRDSEGTVEIQLGVDPLIEGFEEGLLGMKDGGTRILVLPPELGYGSSGQGEIPPNSGVVFRIELLTVTPGS